MDRLTWPPPMFPGMTQAPTLKGENPRLNPLWEYIQKIKTNLRFLMTRKTVTHEANPQKTSVGRVAVVETVMVEPISGLT